MKTKKWLLLSWVALFTVSGWAEYRIWTGVNGSSVEAEFVKQIPDSVYLKTRNGKTKKIPIKKLSETDQKYIEQHQLPKLKLAVHPNLDRTNKAKRRRRQIKKESFSFEIRIEKTSSIPYTLPLTGELFVIGQIDNSDSFVILQNQSISFSFKGKEREKKFEAARVKLNHTKKGRKPEYYGYIVVIRDELGNLVAVKTNRAIFEKNIAFFKGIKTGRKFDNKFNKIQTKREKRKDPSSKHLKPVKN